MDWYLWTLIGWFAFGAVSTVSQVGKPREPLRPSTAALTVIVAAGLSAGLLVTR